MAKKTAPLLPSTQNLLTELGERLKLARLRRKLTAKQVAERAGMTPMTLRSLESGGSGVTVGAYLSVMQVLGIESDLALLGAEDKLGRRLQDSRLANPRAHLPGEARAVEREDIEKAHESTARVEAPRPLPEPRGTTSKHLASLLIHPSKKRAQDDKQ